MNHLGVIVGGGIAGLAVGLYAQKHGLALPILEKQATLACEDNLLWLAPNGLHLLTDLGVMAELEPQMVAQQSMLFTTKQLKELTSLDCRKLTRSNGFPIVAIKRAALCEVLRRRFVAQGGEIAYGQLVSTIRQDGDQVTLRLGEDLKPVVYDYVIAADGIGSSVRRQVFAGSEVRYQGICTYLGRSVTPVSERYVGRTIEAWGVGTRFMLTSLDGQTTYWSAIERPEVYLKNSAPIEADRVQRLRRAFADYHPDVGQILDAAVPPSLHRCNFGVVEGLSSYAAGRVALVGDSAHGMPPNMGQGASLALEDAAFLVQALVRAATVEQAFAEYDRHRRPRAKQMVQIANSMNLTFQPKGRLASSVRNLAAATFPAGLSQMRMAHLYKVPFALASV